MRAASWTSAFWLELQAALTVEILERIEEETTYARDAQLRDRLAVWRERLKAEVI